MVFKRKVATRYNLGNDLTSMAGLVDIVRLSPQSDEVFTTLKQFRQNEQGAHPLLTPSIIMIVMVIGVNWLV